MTETLLIKNGVVITVDKRNTIYEDGSIVVQDDRIVDVGETKSIKKGYKPDIVIDAKNKAILPGFINLHLHSGLIRGTAENLSLLDWLRMFVNPKHMVLTKEDAYAASLLCYSEGAKAGITCNLDMYRFMDRCADAAEEVGIRAVLAPYVANLPEYHYLEKLEDNLKLVKTRHNSANGRIQVWFGLVHLTICDEEACHFVAENAKKYGVGIHAHGEESKELVSELTKKYGKRPSEVLYDRGILGPKTVLAHCVWLNQSEIQILAKTRTSVAHCPTSNMKLASGTSPIPDLLKKGVTVGLGSDGIKENNRIDLIQEMKIASLLQKVTRFDASLLPPEEVLRMATINGAKALGLENEIGSIEKGKKADLAIIDLKRLHMSPLLFGEFFNIVTNIVYAAQGSDVDTVIVDGNIVMKGRVLRNVDENKIIDMHTKATAALLERRKAVVPKD